MSNTNITVIIVTYNSESTIKDCLQSIYDVTKNINYEIIIIDNASNDNSILIIETYFPWIKIIKNDINVGFGRANNLALQYTSAKYIFLLNPDALLFNNAIKILHDFMENEELNNTRIWCCGGNLYNTDMSLQNSYGHFPSLLQIFFEFGLYRFFPRFYDNNLSISTKFIHSLPQKVDYVSGANMFLCRNLINQYGFFDKDFFLYYEETELSCRMSKHGYYSILVPDAKIIHLGEVSSKNLPHLDKFIIVESSKYLFFKKCYGKIFMLISKFLYLIKYSLLYGMKRNPIYKRYIYITFNSFIKNRLKINS